MKIMQKLFLFLLLGSASFACAMYRSTNLYPGYMREVENLRRLENNRAASIQAIQNMYGITYDEAEQKFEARITPLRKRIFEAERKAEEQEPEEGWWYNRSTNSTYPHIEE